MKSGRYLDLQARAFPLFLAVTAVVLAGAACGKKSSANADDSNNAAVVAALDKNTQAEEAKEPKKDIKGVDLAKLDSDQKKVFERLSDSLVSPCGKAESLRRSATVSKDCKRSIFALRYIAIMLADGANEDQVREHYGRRYVNNNKVEIKLGEKVPHSGSVTAPIVIVEFMDYGCGACQRAKPEIDKVIAAYPSDVVVYYKQYPLTHAHPLSQGAAQAAVAAGKQGKYKQMHDVLFAKHGAHKKDELVAYAKSIGLDMAKFEADFAAAVPAIDADMKEGTELHVNSTPTFFVNGRKFQDPADLSYFANWIAEETAVNR